MTATERAPTVAGLILRGNAAAAAIAAGACGVALLAAWFVPTLATVVIWPLLFVVPGWMVVAWLKPRIAATGRLGLAIVLSVALSAHLVYWLSVLLGGYRRETIFLAAAVLMAPLVAVAWRAGLSPFTAQLRDGVRALRRNGVAFAVAALSAAFVGLTLDSGLWHPTDTGVSAGGSNWSDLGVHLSIAQSLNAGNFPPQVPYFAGAPLVYHWFADFHAAIAAKAAGMFAIPAFVTSSAILAGALALLVHGLARRLLRGRGARRAAVLATVLVVFGGGLAWMRLVGDVAAGHGDPISLVTAHSYDNSWYDSQGEAAWPYFRIPSVMATGLLVHRATTLGLPILVGAILLLVAGLPTRDERRRGARDRPPLILAAGVLGALLAPFHFFFFPAFAVVALLYVVIGRRLLDRRCSAQRRPAAGALHPGRPVRRGPAAERQRLGGAEVLPRLGVGPAGRRAGRGRLLLPHQPGPAVRAGHLRPLRARPEGQGLPGRLGGGAVRDPEPDAGQRRRVRHEQVLPGDVDRGCPAGGVVHPPLAVAGDRAGAAASRFRHRCWWPAGPPSTASRCWTGTGSRRRTGSPPTRPTGRSSRPMAG